MSPGPSPLDWYLEGFEPASRRFWRIPLTRFPCRIGRRSDLEITLPSQDVSLEHAELLREGEELDLRDLGSTNGTFVDGERIDAPVRVREGSIIHFASLEFRVGRLPGPGELTWLRTATPSSVPPLRRLIDDALSLRRLVDERRVEMLFQPIVRLPGRELIGCEVLGRGLAERLPVDPSGLFSIAEQAGLELELAALFRERAIAEAVDLPAELLLFLNVHPAELGDSGLLSVLTQARRERPELKVIIEVSEASATPLARLRELRGELSAIGVGIAYDDFGAGLARLNEIVEVPPDFLKFDASLVQGLDRAPEPRRRFVSALVEAARSLRIDTVAEGVETEDEIACCAAVGFSCAQGFALGRPTRLPREAR